MSGQPEAEKNGSPMSTAIAEKMPSKWLVRIKSMLPFVLGVATFAGTVQLFMQVMEPLRDDTATDTSAKLIYALRWNLWALIPLVLASLKHHSTDTVKAFVRKSFEEDLVLLLNTCILATFLETVQLQLIPSLVATAVIFRFLHWYSIDSSEWLQCFSGCSSGLCNVSLLVYNLSCHSVEQGLDTLGIIGCITGMIGWGKPAEASGSSGWF
ncbi:uncharacterized protein LOC106161824 isoform X2 [Lingula anatina]|uniref:Uncharacterized protein LOC106161824 isoform X2 n=1 Tax=Lingula anatina TaxID=7574 RepID=A0A1S3I7T7_LINAN|nr:uncharacterized protein LOC106161824 isoform X2 [Lingula anatina]XP_013394330.1 uncharacterized protein LOC106161824 isoform X2 [Lingula anatina]|eukprot:XP_013394319.1 uncharacterized protein LOC106161824 isoform X2 [Lingula anatina]